MLLGFRELQGRKFLDQSVVFMKLCLVRLSQKYMRQVSGNAHYRSCTLTSQPCGTLGSSAPSGTVAPIMCHLLFLATAAVSVDLAGLPECWNSIRRCDGTTWLPWLFPKCFRQSVEQRQFTSAKHLACMAFCLCNLESSSGSFCHPIL